MPRHEWNFDIPERLFQRVVSELSERGCKSSSTAKRFRKDLKNDIIWDYLTPAARIRVLDYFHTQLAVIYRERTKHDRENLKNHESSAFPAGKYLVGVLVISAVIVSSRRITTLTVTGYPQPQRQVYLERIREAQGSGGSASNLPNNEEAWNFQEAVSTASLAYDCVVYSPESVVSL